MTENKGDLISRSEAEKLGATCLARRNENGQLEAIISLDNAPTVVVDCKNCDGYEAGYSAGVRDTERPQGEIFPMEIVAGKCPIEAGGNCPLRPQGKWIWNEEHHCYVCSLCGAGFEDPPYLYNFCPDCGAQMVKGGAE